MVPGRTRWYRSPGRRRVLALATSLLVHGAALLLLLAPRPLLPPPTTDAEPIAVEFIETPPAEVEPAPAPLPEPAPAEPTSPARRRPQREPRAEAPAPGADETPAEIPSEPAAAEPGGTLDMRAPPASLTLDYDAVDRLSRDGVIDRPQLPLGRPSGKPRGPSFGEKVAALARNDEARRNVERGDVHPQAYDYMRGAQRLFRPDPDIVYRDERAPNTVGRSLKQWGRGALQAVLPWTDVEELDRERESRAPHRQGPEDMFKKYNGWTKGTEKAARPMACLVCLVIRPGEIASVELAASSGSKEVDRAAVEALERTAQRRPTDPEVRKQRSCYRFSVKVIRIPPVPIVGCSFDEAALTASCYYPTKKLTKTQVHLESVDYDG
jgi:outer membrane biosynthesis protein TonB